MSTAPCEEDKPKGHTKEGELWDSKERKCTEMKQLYQDGQNLLKEFPPIILQGNVDRTLGIMEDCVDKKRKTAGSPTKPSLPQHSSQQIK